MANEITVTIRPGCPSVVVAKNKEERAAAEAALAARCGCVVEVETAIARARAEAVEAEAAIARARAEAVEVEESIATAGAEATGSEESTEEGQEEEEPVCGLEPNKLWSESICKKLVDAGADDVIARLTELGLI
jgi:hypothetical protein